MWSSVTVWFRNQLIFVKSLRWKTPFYIQFRCVVSTQKDGRKSDECALEIFTFFWQVTVRNPVRIFQRLVPLTWMIRSFNSWERMLKIKTIYRFQNNANDWFHNCAPKCLNAFVRERFDSIKKWFLIEIVDATWFQDVPRSLNEDAWKISNESAISDVTVETVIIALQLEFNTFWTYMLEWFPKITSKYRNWVWLFKCEFFFRWWCDCTHMMFEYFWV